MDHPLTVTAMKTGGLPLLLALGLTLLLAAFPDSSRAQTSRATVRLDGRALFQVSADNRDQARSRADEIERRLNRLLETPKLIEPVKIEQQGDARLLSVAGRPLAALLPDDASDNGITGDALAAEWKNAIDATLAQAATRRLSAWGRFAVETQASVETAFARLLESAIVIIPRLLASLLVLLSFWMIAALVRWLMRLVFHRFVSDLTVENLIKQVAYYTVWAIGLIVATSALGFDPQALATGLGLTSVALGFALKDILSNFVAGILILAMRPFKIGDQIVIGNTEGGVERINLRATHIRTYDGRAVLVPNAEVFTSRVTNNTESPVRRGVIEIPLDYQTDLKSAANIMRRAAQNADGVLADPPANVRVRELKEDAIILEARFWTDSRRSDFVLTCSNVRTAVVEAFKTARLALPDPSVRVLVSHSTER
ncbi:MAG: mechanosensitive ion channel family protein [Candidatus Competibacteraceae bacterium]|nr:mechanosensitive ion channel family protein [Candidatus Competibacteraceae bacterium]